MARKKKYPKQPKRSASLAVWQRYEARCKEIDKFNKAIEEKPAKIDSIKARIMKARR